MARDQGKVAFPHPVIGFSDDIDGAMLCESCKVEFDVEETRFVFSEISTTNGTLQELLDAKKAKVICQATCSATYFRTVIELDVSTSSFSLPSGKLHDAVDLRLRICAAEDLPSYAPTGLNTDFGEISFVVKKGDILAFGPEFTAAVDKAFDPLDMGIASIMQIRCGNHDTGPFRGNFHKELIEIELSKEDWASYGVLKSTGPHLLHASIVLPILIQAIYFVQTDVPEKDVMQDFTWYSRIKQMLDAKPGAEAVQLFEAAQLLLGNPLTRAFKELNSLRDHE